MSKMQKHSPLCQDTHLPPSPVHTEASLEEGERERSAQLQKGFFLTGRVVQGQQTAYVGLCSLSLLMCDHLKGLEGL